MSFMAELVTDLAQHISVLVAMIIGLAGGIFASIYSQYRQSKREKYKELRSNLLAVTIELSKVRAWASKQGYPYLFGTAQQTLDLDKKSTPSPIEKIEATVFLYFPEICNEANELSVSAMRYELYLIKLAQKHQNERPVSLTKDEQIERQKLFGEVLQHQKNLVKSSHALMSSFLDEKPGSGGVRNLFGKLCGIPGKLRNLLAKLHGG